MSGHDSLKQREQEQSAGAITLKRFFNYFGEEPISANENIRYIYGLQLLNY